MNLNEVMDVEIGALYKGCALVNADKVKTVAPKRIRLQDLYLDEKQAWMKNVFDFADKTEGRNK